MNYVEARTTTTKRCGVQKAIAVMTITAICITLIGFMLPMVKIQDKTFKILQLFHNASFRVSKRTFQADVIVLSALLLLSISDIRSDCTSSDGFWASLTIRSLLSLSHVLLLRRMFMFVITMRSLLSISYAIGGYSIMAPAAPHNNSQCALRRMMKSTSLTCNLGPFLSSRKEMSLFFCVVSAICLQLY